MEATHRRHDISNKAGSFWNRIFQAEKEPEVLLFVIIEIFSMRFFRFC